VSALACKGSKEQQAHSARGVSEVVGGVVLGVGLLVVAGAGVALVSGGPGVAGAALLDAGGASAGVAGAGVALIRSWTSTARTLLSTSSSCCRARPTSCVAAAPCSSPATHEVSGLTCAAVHIAPGAPASGLINKSGSSCGHIPQQQLTARATRLAGSNSCADPPSRALQGSSQWQ
jgi:hypothetical protein